MTNRDLNHFRHSAPEVKLTAPKSRYLRKNRIPGRRGWGMAGRARKKLGLGVVTLAVGWLAFATVRSAVGQPADGDYQVMKSRNLAFDLNVDADQKSAIHSIELYVCRDNSGVWELGNTATPDAKSILYTAKDDGVYLINMVIVYKTGVRDPADVTKAAPLQKLLVDATAPVVRLTADRKGDDVQVAWSVDERNPADAKTKLEWKPTGDSELAWKSVTISSADRRSALFNPAGAAATVRVTVEDAAGNVTMQSKDVAGSTTTAFATPASIPAPDLKLGNEVGLVLPKLAPVSNLAPLNPPAPVIDLTPKTSPAIAPPMIAPPTMPTPAALPAPVTPAGPAPLVMGSGLGGTTTAPSAEMPGVKVINFLKFDVPYQLEAGPSGISKIELYVTRDDGKSWSKWSVHDGEQKPLRVALDTRANVQPEGPYGFRLVPISGAGISELPPTEGAVPDFRVLVDLSPPLIKVYAPEADPNRPGVLTLKWEIKDKNPLKDGVAIAWSDTLAGPWKPIGSETGSTIVAGAGTDLTVRLADTGSFAWKLPEKVPARVYLRMTAWDAAGNKSEVTTPDPVLVDLTKPRARIQDIIPVGGVR